MASAAQRALSLFPHVCARPLLAANETETESSARKAKFFIETILIVQTAGSRDV